jgi:mono/diheme cytochrome c family protein
VSRAFAVAVLLAAVIAGCGPGSGGVEVAPLVGGTTGPQAARGRAIFAANCATCHTLSDAGASGNVGPNLDELGPGAAAVARKVQSGGGGMPAFSGRLSKREVGLVAAYVGAVAGE